MSDPITVLFIGGYGRSGSTLLDRLIGTVSSDAVSAGEVRHIWREGFAEDRRCGCGSAFAGCPFWTAAVARAFGDPPGFDLDEIQRHKAVVDRVPAIPLLASARRPRAFQQHLDAYGETLTRLLRAVRDVAGRRIVVDSTKDVAHGWLLRALPDVDLRVVHLVRDSRAVAWSWQRKTFHPGSGRDMDRWGVVRSSFEWDAINVLTAGLARATSPSMRLHYEDLVADPAAALARVLTVAGGDPTEARVLDGASVELGLDHTVAGNPVRFESGRVQIRPDERWRAAMPARSRRVVAGLTLPVRAAMR